MSGPELVIGIIAPFGTDLEMIYDTIESALLDVGYDSQVIKLIDSLKEIPPYNNAPDSPLETKYKTLMDYGRQFRSDLKRGDALAVLAVAQIIRSRKIESNGTNTEGFIPRKAYILRSLKHPQELDTLRRIYGNGFIAISVYSPREIRLQTLAKNIAESHHAAHSHPYLGEAEELMQRDEAEDESEFGQHLRKTFWQADAFIDVTSTGRLKQSLSRFVELVFGNTLHTPTRDEVGMFHAQTAALRSSSLARQVGAAITTDEGDVVAVGTNEVPKAGGGLYWCDDNPDQRDLALGYDVSDSMRRRLLADIINRFQTHNWLTQEKKERPVAELVEEALNPEVSSPMKDARFMSLIEYARAVHAEMAAITDAARRGVAIEGCTLYTTTFPCHDCARHIVAAGIKRVVYVEPYPKSLAHELYPDSITVDSIDDCGSQVRFEPFVGVGPRLYLSLFSMLKRKDKAGKLLKWQKTRATPRFHGSQPSTLRAEKEAVTILFEEMKVKGLEPIQKKEEGNA